MRLMYLLAKAIHALDRSSRKVGYSKGANTSKTGDPGKFTTINVKTVPTIEKYLKKYLRNKVLQ